MNYEVEETMRNTGGEVLGLAWEGAKLRCGGARCGVVRWEGAMHKTGHLERFRQPPRSLPRLGRLKLQVAKKSSNFRVCV